MAYGILKCDTITFTDGGIDKSVAISGLVQNPTFSGNITVTGTISGNLVQGQTVSGVTVTGTTAQFTSGTFISLTGTTIQGTTATYTTGSFTSLTGTTTTGTTANFASGVFTTQISGATITGNAASFTTVTGGTATITSGVFASGTAAAPSVSVGTTNNGFYSPATNQVALSTSGTEALRIDSGGNILVVDGNNLQIDEVRARDGDGLKLFDDGGAGIFVQDGGNVGIGTSSPTQTLHVENGNLINASLTFGASAIQTIRGTFAGAGIRELAIGVTGDSPNNPYLQAKNNSSTAQALLLNPAGGNVGIGTASPARTLHVVGEAVVFNTNQFLVSPTTDNVRLYARDGSTGAQNLSFNIGTTEAARIDTSGRLLVGTSSYTGNSKFAIKGGSGTDVALIDLRFGGSRPTTADSGVAELRFGSPDQTSNNSYAKIECITDGASSSDTDLPARLVFSVTADGSASPSEAMRINNAGELLVGYTSDNGAYKLQVNSQIFATSAIIATSDGRYKENVAALDGCVDLVKALRPVSFDWKAQEPVTRVDEDGETVVVREAHNFPDGKQVGFIAQEVEEVLADKPWLGSVIKQNVRPAVTDADGNELAPEEEFLGIAEGNLVAVLTSALKDAIGRIESLEAKVAALESA